MNRICFIRVKVIVVLAFWGILATNAQKFSKDKGKFHGQITGSYSDVGIKKYILSFAYWSLLGEPVQDFKFYWESNGYFEVTGTPFKLSRTSLSKYPDLIKRFDNIVPVKVRFQLPIVFGLSSEKAYYLGRALSDFEIDLPGRSSDKKQFSVPGSPDWHDFFKYSEVHSGMGMNYGGYHWFNLHDTNKTSINKFIFARADEIVINSGQAIDSKNDSYSQYIGYGPKADQYPFTITLLVEWPQSEIDAIDKEYWKREKGEEPTIMDTIKQATEKPLPTYNKDDFWSDTYEDNSDKIEWIDNAQTKGIINSKKDDGSTFKRYVMKLGKHTWCNGYECTEDYIFKDKSHTPPKGFRLPNRYEIEDLYQMCVQIINNRDEFIKGDYSDNGNYSYFKNVFGDDYHDIYGLSGWWLNEIGNSGQRVHVWINLDKPFSYSDDNLLSGKACPYKLVFVKD